MRFIRADVAGDLRRYGEVMAAAVTALAGVLVAVQGGLILIPMGGLIAMVGAGWAVVAARRAVFLRAVGAPGIVEVDEGQIGYFGPRFGGHVAIADLAELRLVTAEGHRQWRLRTGDGQVLLVPVAARGAAALHDAFAVLPAVDMTALARALEGGAGPVVLWRRAATGPAAPASGGTPGSGGSITRFHDPGSGGPSGRA
jgi:hypothetical protein